MEIWRQEQHWGTFTLSIGVNILAVVVSENATKRNSITEGNGDARPN